MTSSDNANGSAGQERDLRMERLREDGLFSGSVPSGLEKLRRKLLDLSPRNRLLNYRHPKSSSLRVIDELPDIIFRKLADGGSLDVRAVPRPSARDEARRQEEYRERLGSEAIAPKATVIEIATSLGLRTEFDLPSPPRSGERAQERHEDNRIQTLLFPDDMSAALERLRRSARTGIEDKGANLLHLAFGFLEWNDRDGSQPHFAPLILMPISLERGSTDPETGFRRFFLTQSGEDTGENLSLQVKLRREFDLSLPSLDDEKDIDRQVEPEQYFTKLQGILKTKPEWKIRRWVSLGLFEFGKLLLYRDLDPASWPTNSVITSHHLVRPFFEAAENTDGDPSEDYANLDSSTFHARAPLVFEADSSQHSAMLDVLDKKNIVIQGPPGTGKSQTITNLIAASIGAGKSVLFVSEKMAALEVVRRRLDEAGLGNFCLELHSHRTQKQSLLADLQRRLNLRNKFPIPKDLERERRRLEERRKQLHDYAELIAQPWGAIGWTRQRVIAAKVELELRLGDLADRLQPAQIDDVSEIDEIGLDQSAQSTKKFVEAHRRLVADTSWDHHPWRDFNNDQIGFADFSIFRSKVQGMLNSTTELLATLNALEEVCGIGLDRRVAEVSALAASYENWPRIDFVPSAHLATFESAANRQKLQEFTSLLRNAQQARSRAREFFKVNHALPNCPDWERLDRALSVLKSQDFAPFTLDQLRVVEEKCRNAAAVLGRGQDCLRRLSAKIGVDVPPNADGIEAMLIAVEVSSRAPWELLGCRELIADMREAAAVAAGAATQVRDLQSRREELAEKFTMTALPPHSSLVEVAQVFKSTGAFSFLSVRWRRSRSLFQSISRTEKRTRHQDRILWTEKLADYVRSYDAFSNDRRYLKAFGAFFQGIETRFDFVIALSVWLQEIKSRLSVSSIGRQLVPLLSSAEESHLRVIASLKGDSSPDMNDLRKVLISLRELVDLSDIRSLVQSGAELKSIAAACIELSHGIGEIIRTWEAVGLREQLTLTHVRTALVATASSNAAQIIVTGALKASDILSVTSMQEASDPDEVQRNVDFAEALSTANVHAGLRSAAFRIPETHHAKMENALGALSASFARFCALHRDLAKMIRPNDGAWPQQGLSMLSLDQIRDILSSLPRKAQDVEDLGFYFRAKNNLQERGFFSLISAVENATIPIESAPELCRLQLLQLMADQAVRESSQLARFRRDETVSIRDEFCEIDSGIVELQRAELAQLADRRDIPTGVRGGRVSELTERSLIEREIEKQKRHIPIRQLVRRAGRALQGLKPCFMMSPMSVAQYLPPGEIVFDLLVMDEASQIKPEEALGAIARAKQLVVVGDSKQLPPSTFFQSSSDGASDSDSDDDANVAEESESILEAATAIWPQRWLRWHYRSRHEALIAFSNRHFYEDQLVVFPSAWGKSVEFGIDWRFIPNGAFQSGRNVAEAKAVVEIAMKHIEERSESLGIVAMNLDQAELIEDLLEEALKSSPRAEKWVEVKTSSPEPLFIKNLENVQGDERDVIIASFTYGNGAAAPPQQNYGPINREFGWRRLNVLYTRAKKRMVVCASMRHDGVSVDGERRRSLAALRNYLQYAETGQLEQARRTGRAPDSPFEEAVMRALEFEGFTCVPQLGVEKYRIDVAVEHPDRPDVYILGIECDGAPFHSGKSVRDRDRIRQMVLESLGWKIHRVWSPDWYRDAKSEIRRIVAQIEALRIETRANLAAEEAINVDTASDANGSNDDKTLSPMSQTKLDLTTTENQRPRQESLPMAFRRTQRNRSGISREQARAELIALREKEIKQRFSQSDPSRGLLRKGMLDRLIVSCPSDREAFLRTIPVRLREETDTDQVSQYLDRVLEILAEVDED